MKINNCCLILNLHQLLTHLSYRHLKSFTPNFQFSSDKNFWYRVLTREEWHKHCTKMKEVYNEERLFMFIKCCTRIAPTLLQSTFPTSITLVAIQLFQKPQVKTENITFVGLNSSKNNLESKKKEYDQICNLQDFKTKITRDKSKDNK